MVDGEGRREKGEGRRKKVTAKGEEMAGRLPSRRIMGCFGLGV